MLAMSGAIASSHTGIALSALAGKTREVKLAGADEITGRWAEELKLRISRGPDNTLVEQFLNWGDSPEQILRFVRLYGPLSKPDSGNRYPPSALPMFHQSIQEWRAHQASLRRFWSHGRSQAYQIGMRGDEMLRVDNKGGPILIVGSLERFLECEIFLYPAARRHVCECPKCQTPYFIANDIRQVRCGSAECAKWAQQRHALNWWSQHGQKWRETRRKASQTKSRS